MANSLVALWVWYRGTRFHGFQSQPDGPTVQEQLRQAMRSLGIDANPAPAGRTDRGVHARMQVVSFRLPEKLNVEALSSALQPLLDPDIGVCAAVRAGRSFHAQWRAAGKEYRYRFAVASPPASWEPYAWQPLLEKRLRGRTIDFELLSALLAECEGTHDFAAFHLASSPRQPRTLTSVRLRRSTEGLYEISFRGDRFARYQVRFLVGSSIATAAGALTVPEFRAALGSATTMPGLKAAAKGLVLWEVLYPPDVEPFGDDRRRAAPGLPPGPPFEDLRWAADLRTCPADR